MEKTITTMADRCKLEGLEEGKLLGQRRTLHKQLLKKYPSQSEQALKLKLESVTDLEFLMVLTDRILEDLTWEEYWAR